MKNYLLSILAISLCASFLLHLLPEKTSLKKGTQFLAVLLLLLLLLSPLAGAKDALKVLFSGDWLPKSEVLEEEFQAKSEKALSSYSKEYLEELICERLIKAFSIRKEDLRVFLTMEDGEAKKALLLLSGKAIWQDSAKLETFVEDLLGIPTSSAIE